MAKPRAKAGRPQAPEELADEQLLEWNRVCDELESIGKLATVDRAILTLYCQVWAINTAANRHVAQFGAVVPLNNGVICQSPQYRTWRETATQLRRLLSDLGLTPASRGASEEETPDLEF